MTYLNRSLYEKTLREYYTKPLEEWLNGTVEWSHDVPIPASWYDERGLPYPWVYVDKRSRWVKLKSSVKWKVRDARYTVGKWIAGPGSEDWWDNL